MQPITPAAKVQRAREALYDNFKFFAPVAAEWKVIADPTCDTGWTNGPALGYNPSFIDSLPILDTVDFTLHETGHVIFGHHVRMGGRDAQLWNEAADLSLNDRLGQYMQPAGYIRTHGLFPGEGQYAHLPRGKSAEWYYDALMAARKAAQQAKQMAAPQEPQEGQGSQEAQEAGQEPQDGEGSQGEPESDEQGGASAEGEGEASDATSSSAGGSESESAGDPANSAGSGTVSGEPDSEGQGDEPADGRHVIGEIKPALTADEDDPEEAVREWEKMVARAVLVAKEAGSLPGWIQELADEMLEDSSELNWRALMRRFFTVTVPIRPTYDKPNRRTAWRTDFIFPTYQSKEAAPGCVLVDTSGSMNQPAMNTGLTEMSAILSSFMRCEVTLRMADTQLVDTERTFRRWDFPLAVPIEWMGRGGTNLASAIKEIADSRRYKWIAVVSDMWWDVAACPDPGVPVLWITTEDVKQLPAYSTPAFGVVIGPVVAAAQ